MAVWKVTTIFQMKSFHTEKLKVHRRNLQILPNFNAFLKQSALSKIQKSKSMNTPSENIFHCSDFYVDIMKIAANNMTGKTKTMGVTKWF